MTIKKREGYKETSEMTSISWIVFGKVTKDKAEAIARRLGMWAVDRGAGQAFSNTPYIAFSKTRTLITQRVGIDA